MASGFSHILPELSKADFLGQDLKQAHLVCRNPSYRSLYFKEHLTAFRFQISKRPQCPLPPIIPHACSMERMKRWEKSGVSETAQVGEHQPRRGSPVALYSSLRCPSGNRIWWTVRSTVPPPLSTTTYLSPGTKTAILYINHVSTCPETSWWVRLAIPS